MDLSIKHLAWAVLESMQDSLFVTSAEGRIIYLNHAAESLLNVTFSQVFGWRLDQLLNLLPVGPRTLTQVSVSHSAEDVEFNAGEWEGYWLVRLGNDLRLVNIVVSALPQRADAKNNLLFSIRSIRGEGEGMDATQASASRQATVSHDGFHKRILDAQQASRRWNLEHCLICVQFEMKNITSEEYEQVVAVFRSHMRRTDACCPLGTCKYSVLLENYSVAQGIRRAYELIRIMSVGLSEERSLQRALKVWIGLVPVNRFSPADSTQLISMAMQASQEASRSGKDTAVRVYRPGGVASIECSEEHSS